MAADVMVDFCSRLCVCVCVCWRVHVLKNSTHL
jgi:hypothetical protein